MTSWTPEKEPNKNWNLIRNDDHTYSIETITAAVLIDIRRELRKLNELLGCSNFTGIPATLRAIQRNTTKRRKKPKVPAG